MQKHRVMVETQADFVWDKDDGTMQEGNEKAWAFMVTLEAKCDRCRVFEHVFTVSSYLMSGNESCLEIRRHVLKQVASIMRDNDVQSADVQYFDSEILKGFRLAK